LCVGWDEGGRDRKNFDYLVDSLPNLSSVLPNVFLPSLAETRRPSAGFVQKIQRVLVAFGGGDPARLTEPTLELLRRSGWRDGELSIVAVKGPGSRFSKLLSGVEVWDAPENLRDRLHEFDLLIGSWGLTALEALSRGVSFISVPPTRYHDRLARKLRLARISPFSVAGLKRAWAQAVLASKALATSFPEHGPSAEEYWRDFLPPAELGHAQCPACSKGFNPVIARTEKKTYLKCRRCGLEYLLAFQTPVKVYEEAYFFEEYQRQYGKTYLEDFASIKKMAEARIGFAEKLWGSWSGLRVLDVGCAYGPFLAACAEAGAQPYGLDVSASAVAYVQKQLGYPARVAAFPGVSWSDVFSSELLPDVVSMWYVIEHFPQIDQVLRRVAQTLPLGGKFIFATPNGLGISRRFSPQVFWEQSPSDHFTVWNPHNARSVLRRFGFAVEGIRITGHHPERFPGFSRSRWQKLIVNLDEAWGWGDTFEVYARKIADHEVEK
jgi:2-polyprenyl-3-methyl-5-hydroxy-6-metoxy-1,4-benzoquinol methylase